MKKAAATRKAPKSPTATAVQQRASSPTLSFVPPQLATLVDAAPAADDWLHELKFDGFRIQCRIHHGEVTLFTRTGQDWTARFTKVAVAAARIDVQSALIDGEVAVLRPDGTTSFQSLQNHLQGDAAAALTYFAFDLLFLNGDDLRPKPLEQRKAALAKILSSNRSSGTIRYTDHVTGNGPAFFDKASASGLEGIVSKLRTAAYVSGRTPSWVKTKALKRQEFVVGGFTEPEGARSGIGALLVGLFRDGRLLYAGKVGTGFSQKMSLALRAELDRLLVDRSPFSATIRGAGRQIRWVRPQLVAEIAYGEITGDGKLRHPSFQGLRPDKRAADVRQDLETPVSSIAPLASPIASSTTRPRAAKKPGEDFVAGVRLTHADRLLEPEARLTKRDVAGFYEAIAPLMLPHLIDRPLSLVRCPEGTAKTCFFMKHAAFSTPELDRIPIEEKNETSDYLVASTVAGLVSLTQMSVLEVHTWNSVRPTLEMPDRVVFDFDPGPQAAWQDVLDGARSVKERVEKLGCATFVKTTGGKGLHVVVPLIPSVGWEECKAFTRIVSESVVMEYPNRFTTAMPKAGREAKVLIDYFRNHRGSTSVATYSTRARPGLPVSVPIAWDELDDFKPGRPFTMASTLQRIRGRFRDPWAEYDAKRVSLEDILLKGSRSVPSAANPPKPARGARAVRTSRSSRTSG